MTESFPTVHDVVRLLHGGACSFLARQNGVAPDIMEEERPSRLSWRDFAFAGTFRRFEGELMGFLGLAGDSVLASSAMLIDSAKRILSLWMLGEKTVVFHTSGSTGKAMPWAHDAAMIRQETAAIIPLFPGIRRVVGTTPFFHSYGFIFGFLLPRIAGVPGILLPPFPSIVSERLRPGDLVVGFPLLLGSIMNAPSDGVRCLTSTAPCPPGLFARLHELGFAGLTEIYGSSETGALGFRTEEDQPFTLLSHWSRKGNGAVARTAVPGFAGAVYPLPDRVEWVDERRLVPRGRVDKAVQVAGMNVYPEKVAEVIRAHPMVRECAVRLMRPDEGVRLKVFVVLREGCVPQTARSALREYLKKELETAERPGRMTFGDELPRTLVGKLCDWDG